MAKFLTIIPFALLASASAWSVDTRCPMAFNTGSVGSCKVWGCSKSRGPTHCTIGKCYCNEGFCRYPSTTLHVQSRYCAARIPGATCHVSHMCWSGGLMTSMCDSGLCMCKWNHHPVKVGEGKYECREGMSNLAAAMANNATQEEIQDLLDNQQHADRMAAYNVLTGAAWVVAAAGLVVGGLAIRSRRSTIAINGYKDLLG